MKSNPDSKSTSKDSLFLLEVLVDKIVFEKGPCYPDKEFKTCVSITAATMEPLEICDDESCLHSNNPFVKHFNCGKSCLFSLKEGEINSALSKFPVTCTIVKSLPCGCLPSTIAVGEATIDMTKEFMLARQSHLDDPTAVSYQALKDSFKIKGPDGNNAGEIMMFLRISCFGHNITTKFQGSGTPGQGILTGGGGGRGICNPQKARQSICSCSGAQNPCVLEDEHYSQMPCMDNEEACYCCGKKNGMTDPTGCRNTDAYCLHLPKGDERSIAMYEEWQNNVTTTLMPHCSNYSENNDVKISMSSYFTSIHDYVVSVLPPLDSDGSLYSLDPVVTPTESNCRNYPHPDENLFNLSKSFNVQQSCHQKRLGPPVCEDLFGHTKHKTFTPETTVYNMVVCDHKPYRTSATQATASMNKCLQVYSKGNRPSFEKAIASLKHSRDLMDQLNNPEVHFINVFKTFCGKNKNCENKRCPKNSGNKKPTSSADASASNQSKCDVPSNVQSTGTSTKAVMIDETGCVPSNCEEKRREKAEAAACCKKPCCSPCPPSGGVTVHGANDKNVKVTSAGNPRRGVFEIVIRRLTGAPLGKNELMLEWTPPPMIPPCSTPCCPRCPPYPCTPCPPPKTCKPARVSRLVICPLPFLPKCQPCCKRSCVRPCRKPGCAICCKPKCCARPCGPVPRCGPCPNPPCGARPCSTPCFRSCPVGRRRPRRCRSQPRIRSHPKRESPCHNRAPSCPAVRCSRPCMSCCALPYPPRLSCSTVRSARSKSGCSSCCP